MISLRISKIASIKGYSIFHRQIKSLLAIVFFLTICTDMYPQFVISKSTSDRIEGKLKKQVLDKATLRCWYEFTHYCLNEGVKEQVIDTFTLDVGLKYSVYYDQNRFMRDSVYASEGEKIRYKTKLIRQGMRVNEIEDLRKQGNGVYRELSNKGETSKVYKNKQKQYVMIVDGDMNAAYKCIDEVCPQSWNLNEDTMAILGYVCQKAETTFRGRQYIAWFTPEIPIQDGPWKLYGLPGLILKVEVDNGVFAFQTIGLQALNDFPINILKDQYFDIDRKRIRTLEFKKKYIRNYLDSDGVLSTNFDIDRRLFEELEIN